MHFGFILQWVSKHPFTVQRECLNKKSSSGTDTKHGNTFLHTPKSKLGEDISGSFDKQGELGNSFKK